MTWIILIVAFALVMFFIDQGYQNNHRWPLE
jgi:hypothetical protein